MKDNDTASPHTVKKFELITAYVTGWKEKLLMLPACKNLLFIDCMSSKGEYTDVAGKKVLGTPVRVAKLLREAASRYPDKNIYVILNDIESSKIEHLKTLIDDDTENYHVEFYCKDCNILIRELWRKIAASNNTHYLLFYDPYDAAIDWDALRPFFSGWGEVIINHMLSDTIRASGAAKRPEAVNKYEAVYQTPLAELIKWGSDRKKYEECV